MKVDEDKIDNAGLALLYLTLHEDFRAWKQLDFDLLNRLFEKGFIENPINKTKSIVFTETGLIKSEEMFKKLLCK